MSISLLHSACIAIIDDDESFCRSSSRMLRAAGFQSTAFLSAEEFLQHPAPWRFGCLLVDVQLGGLSGLELAKALQDRGDHLPIIFVSSYEDPEARAEGRRLGCVGWFRKTDDVAGLIRVLNYIFGVDGELPLRPI
jgi:FixJ family two-component response regulator